MVAVGEEEEEQVVEEIPSTSGTDPSVPKAPSGSRVRGGGRVLTDRVLFTHAASLPHVALLHADVPHVGEVAVGRGLRVAGGGRSGGRGIASLSAKLCSTPHALIILHTFLGW